MILKPVMVWLPSLALDLAATQTQILVLEAAMPSALLTVVPSFLPRNRIDPRSRL